MCVSDSKVTWSELVNSNHHQLTVTEMTHNYIVANQINVTVLISGCPLLSHYAGVKQYL